MRHSGVRLAWSSASIVVVLSLLGVTRASDSSFLTKHAGFSAADVQRIERGEVVAQSLPADSAEVALAAAAIIRVPIAFYLERFNEIESFKRDQEVRQVGRFSPEPSIGDLSALTLPPEDVSALRTCEPGHCAVKLDAAGMQRIAARKADVNGAFREHLAAYVRRYLSEGNSALMAYADKQPPQRIADELRHIVDRSPYLRQQWPALGAAVADFDGTVAAPLRHFLYWSSEGAGGKPVTIVTHAIIRPEAGGSAIVATKQLYASHYMTGSLGLTVLVDRGTAAEPRTLLIYVNRTRVDVFDGFLSIMKRALVRSRARAGAERMLGALRERLQREFQTAK